MSGLVRFRESDRSWMLDGAKEPIDGQEGPSPARRRLSFSLHYPLTTDRPLSSSDGYLEDADFFSRFVSFYTATVAS